MRVRKLIKAFLIFLSSLAGFLLLVFVIMNLPCSHRYLTGRVNNILKNNGIPVHINYLGRIFPGSVSAEGILITGTGGDTIIYSGRMEVSFRTLAMLKKRMILPALKLDNTIISLLRRSADDQLNIAEAFAGNQTPEPVKVVPEAKPWDVSVGKAEISDIKFRMIDSAAGIYIREDIRKIRLGTRRMSLVEKTVIPAYLEIEGSTGSITMNSQPSEVSAEDGSSWSFAPGDIHVSDINFVFDDPARKLRLDLLGSDIRLEAPGTDLTKNLIDFDRISVTRTICRIFSDNKPEETGPPDQVRIPVIPWSVRGGLLSFNDVSFSMLNYTVPAPDSLSPGFSLAGVSLDITDIITDSINVNAEIRSLEGNLGNGFTLKKVKGKFTSGKGGTRLDLDVASALSRIRIKGKTDENFFSLMNHPAGIAKAELLIDHSLIDLEDLYCFIPGHGENLSSEDIPSQPVEINADLELNGNLLAVNDFKIMMKSVASISMKGNIRDIFYPRRAVAGLNFRADITGSHELNGLIGNFMDGITLPPFKRMSAEGIFAESLMSPHLELKVASDIGNASITGSADLNRDNFEANASFRDINLGSILNSRLLGTLNGSAGVYGRGLTKKPLEINANLLIDSVGLKDYSYRGARIGFNIMDSIYDMHLDINDPSLSLDLSASVKLAGNEMSLNAGAEFKADLYEINLSNDTIVSSGRLIANLKKYDSDIYGEAGLYDIIIRTPDGEDKIRDLKFYLKSDSGRTELDSSSDFFVAEGHADRSVSGIGDFFEGYYRYLGALIDPRKSNVPRQLPLIPEISGRISLNYSKVLKLFMPDTSLVFKNISVFVRSAPERNLIRYSIKGNSLKYKDIEIGGLNAQFTDSVSTFDLRVIADTCRISQQPLNKIGINSHFADWKSLSDLSVIDRNDKVVYFIEINTEADSNFVQFKVPSASIIMNGGKWNLESPDIMQVNTQDGSFTPTLGMQRDSSKIYLRRDDMAGWRTIKLELEKVRLSDLLRTEVFPGEPDFTASGSADYSVNDAMSKRVTGDITLSGVNWSDMRYKLISLNGSFSSDTSGFLSFDASSAIDSAEIKLKGTGKPGAERDINAEFERIPVNTVEPFVSKYLSDLRGKISGNFRLKSRGEVQTLDGEFFIRDGNLKINTLNSSYRLPDEKISFSDKKMIFSKFRVFDSLSHELNVDGFIDFSNRNRINANLEISTSNLQVMNRKAGRNATFYGDVFVNSRLSVKGPVASPVFSGKIALAKGTDIYFRQTENLNFSERQNIVTFTGNRTTSENEPEKPLSAYGMYNKTTIASVVEIDPDTRLNIEMARKMFDISMSVKGGGEINYNMLVNNQENLTGRYEINEGTANLKMVGWPNKTFRLKKGGYIRWDGRIEDPELQLEAINSVKSSYVNPVDNKERYVDFDVALKLSNRLSDMDILFTINTADQYLMSIINTMSPEEQMRQAITILLFEYIDLPGISTSSNYVSEQVNQMVASQLNSLTRTTIKGIDISFGIDTYTHGTSSGSEQTRTSLSYEVRKNLLNDRAKIEFSGIVSDVNQSHSSNTSLNNFTFEYRIDSAGTKFLKVYNEHSYEDVFEGDVVKTGIGFTYRKNYPSLRDIWRRKEKTVKQEIP